MKRVRSQALVGITAAGLLAVLVAAAVESRASAATAQPAHERPAHKRHAVAPPRGANVYVRTETGEEIHGRAVAVDNGRLVIRTSPWRHRTAFMVDVPQESVAELSVRAPDLGPLELLAVVNIVAAVLALAAEIARSA